MAERAVLHHDRMTPGDVRFFATDKNERFWVYCVNETENFQDIAQTFGQDEATLRKINKQNPCHDGSYILLPSPPQEGPPTSIGGTGQFLHLDRLGMETSTCAACGTAHDLNTHFLLFDILLCKLCWITAYGKYETMENICVICGQEAKEDGHKACDFHEDDKCIVVLCEKHLKEHPLANFDGKELCEAHAAEHRKAHNIEAPSPRNMQSLKIGRTFKLVLRDTFDNTTPFDIHGVTASRHWRNEYQDYLDPATPPRKAQTAMEQNKLLRRKLELAFNNRAKHSKVTEKSQAVHTILAKITNGAADKYCGMCVHTSGRRESPGCVDSPSHCWFSAQCKGVKETINEWVVASAVRRRTEETDDPSMNTTLADLIGPSRFALLGLFPPTLCSRAFMQRAAETIEEEFTLSVGSLEIFDTNFDLFRSGHANEIHRAPQRFARMIKRWSEKKHHSKSTTATARNKDKQKQAAPVLARLIPSPRDNSGPASKHNTTAMPNRTKRAKLDHPVDPTHSMAATFSFEKLHSHLSELTNFWQGTPEEIDKTRDLNILLSKKHNGIFFADTDHKTLTELGYGQRFAKQILFFMTKKGYEIINSETK